MSYALGTRGYIPNLKDWDKDLYKDPYGGPGGEVRYKVNKDDPQWLSERQISEIKSDFLNKAQAEHTDKQYWSDIRFNESVRGTLGNIRDIFKPNPYNEGVVGDDRTTRPNMDVPGWMKGEGDAPKFSNNYTISPENYSKYYNKKTGHFHSLLHQKQALNQYDEDRGFAERQSKIDQGYEARKPLDQDSEESRIEREAVIAELNKPVSNPQKPDTSGDANVDSTEKVKQIAESKAVSAEDLEKERQANLDEQISAGSKTRETTFGPEGTETEIKDVPQNKTDQPDPNAAQKNFDKIAGAIHGLATIAKALDTGEYTPPRIPSSWESVKSKTAEVSTVDPDDDDKNRWRRI